MLTHLPPAPEGRPDVIGEATRSLRRGPVPRLLARRGRTEPLLMATYVYHCDAHGTIEATAPLGSPAESWPCRVCGQHSRRVFVPIGLARRGAYVRAIDRAERTRDEPQTVTRLPETAHWRSDPTLRVYPTRSLPRP